MRLGLLLVSSLILLPACDASSKDDVKAEKDESSEKKEEPKDDDEAGQEEAEREEADDEVPAKLDKESFSAKDLDGNGLKAKALACDGKGEMMTLLTNVAGLASVKDELQACADEKIEPRVMYEVKGGKVANVKVADAGGAKACVAKAVGGAKIRNLEGTCLVTLSLGE